MTARRKFLLALEIEGRADRLREGLRKLGYVEGRNIRFEERAAGDRVTNLRARKPLPYSKALESMPD